MEDRKLTNEMLDKSHLKISVIVPVYNVEPYLRRCIKSLINQTHKNIEIILVDDESPDNCGAICDNFAKEDDRIVVVHKKNGGLCSARNAGLDIATGDFIGFVDSDDWVEDDMFEYLLEHILSYNADVSCCSWYNVNYGKKPRPATKNQDVKIYNKDEAIENIVCSWTIRTLFWNKLFKRSMFDNFTFPNGVIYEGTNSMHKLLQSMDTLVYAPSHKYYYRKHNASIVHTATVSNQAQCTLSHINRYQDLCDSYPKLKSILIRHILNESLKLIYICYNNPIQISKEMEKLEIIKNFLNFHHEYISSMPYISRFTLKKLLFLTTLNKSKLKQAKCLDILGKHFKNPYQKCRQIMQKTKNTALKVSNKIRNIVFGPYIRNNIAVGINSDDYSNKDKSILKQLHFIELELIEELVKICDKHGLKYYLYGGTLLGAVRHKGFIPWDDDVDIAMPRDDFEKLAAICELELDKAQYFYQTCFTDVGFTKLFAKIRKNDTYVGQVGYDGENIHNGIFIDIMPLDNFPSTRSTNKIMRKFQWLHTLCTRDNIRSLLPHRHLLFKINKNNKLKNYKKRDRFLKKLHKGKASHLVCSFGSHYKPHHRRIMQKKWFTGDTYMEFEGKKYRVPKGWEQYLVHLYGANYMDLPPVESRVGHFNFYKVKFDEKGAHYHNEKI